MHITLKILNLNTRIQVTNDRFIALQNGDTKVCIRLDLPFCVHYDENLNFDGYLSQRNDEKELEQYLLGLSFPLDILEVYDNILKLTPFPVFDLDLAVSKKLNDQEFINTDRIEMRHGVRCMIARNGKTITLDDSGNWSYKSIGVSMDRENGLKVNLSAQMDGNTTNELSAIKQMNQILEEVQEVKHLARSLFKKN